VARTPVRGELARAADARWSAADGQRFHRPAPASAATPCGWIGVIDFYVARKYPADSFGRHSWATRTFWPTWFANDNVYPSPDHVPYLHQHFTPAHFEERRSRIRFFPVLTTPYYLFVGRNDGK